ncbi:MULTISPECIES: diacylglycerol kinase family protein [Paenibacillus]|uniref:diacylglycerol kinase family protein n=1 Tax=Paenibacillus TaxID=44249 RepID=UPI00037573CA|nr:diacylglycerol kinase family protein [Paenibacillus massiliensis]
MRERSWRLTFRHAWEGIVYAFRTQINMRVHVAATLLVGVMGYILHISVIDWLFVITAMALVLVAEMINTAIETTVDLISPEFHPLAKIAKDTAAGAVLMAAVFAVIVGCIVFFEPVMHIAGQLVSLR